MHLPAPSIAGSHPALSAVLAVSCVAGYSHHSDSTHWMTPPAVTIPSVSHHRVPWLLGPVVAETTVRGLGSALICPPRGFSCVSPAVAARHRAAADTHHSVGCGCLPCFFYCSGDYQAGAAHAPPALQTSASPPAVRAPAPTGCPGGAGRRSHCPRAGAPEPCLSWGSRGQVPCRASRPGAHSKAPVEKRAELGCESDPGGPPAQTEAGQTQEFCRGGPRVHPIGRWLLAGGR